MAQYGKVEYWDERYTKEKEPFDWYQRYSGIRHYLTPDYLAPSQADNAEENGMPGGVTGSLANLNEDNFDGLASQSSTFPPREKCRVLVVGCGNSRLGEEMLNDNWTGGITNIDYSSVVISQMREKYNDDFYKSLHARLERERNLKKKTDISAQSSSEDGIKKTSGRKGGGVKSMLSPDSNDTKDMERPMIKMMFECADITKSLPFPDESFDLILCKGTLDAVLCSTGSIASAASMMEECSRVLDQRHGVMLVLSHGSPDSRLLYFERKDEGEWWDGGVDVHTIPKPRIGVGAVEEKDASKNHFLYICRTCKFDGNAQKEASVSVKAGTSNNLSSLRQSKSNEENRSASVSAVNQGLSSLKLQESRSEKSSARNATIM